MVTDVNILSSSQNSQLFAIKQTSRALDVAQQRLASGLKVNSALENPGNFFASFSLGSEANSLNRTLDRIGQSITAIRNAETAANTLENFISQAETVAKDVKATLLADQQDIGSIILADNPVLYYRLNETSGTTATNYGTGGAALDGTYSGGVTLNSGTLSFGLNNDSIRLNGADGRVDIPNDVLLNTDVAGYTERTVEITFQAEAFGGKQVIFELGGTSNAFSIYLDNDQLYFVANDAGDFGPFNISQQIEENTTYNAAFVFDSANGSFTAYLNGDIVGSDAVSQPFSQTAGAIAIGRNSSGTVFHDGPNSGNGEYFNGKVSDFALYNTVLSQADLQERYNATQLPQAAELAQELQASLDLANDLIEDSALRGINLLNDDNLTTYLNVEGTSSLVTEGRDLTTSGLGISRLEFLNFNDVDSTINEFTDIPSTLENFRTGLSNDLNLLQTRQDFTESKINTLRAGSEDLIRADEDEEAANALILQIQREIQLSTFALSTQGSSIANLLGRSNPLLS